MPYAGVAELVDAPDLKLECFEGNLECRTAQIRGKLKRVIVRHANPEPSL